MTSERRHRTPGREARDVRLWLLPEAWECLLHIALRSDCSVGEVIEGALDDWAESTFAVAEGVPPSVTVHVGRFYIEPDERP